MAGRRQQTSVAWTRVAVISQPDPHPDDGIASSLPDVPGTGADGGPPFLKYVATETDINDDFQLKHRGIFGGKLQGHPTDPNHWIMARDGAAYVSKAGTTLESSNGPEFEKLDLPDYLDLRPDATRSRPAPSPMPPRILTMNGGSAPTYGEVFRTDDAGAHWQQDSIGTRIPGALRTTFTAQSNQSRRAGISAAGAVAVT